MKIKMRDLAKYGIRMGVVILFLIIMISVLQWIPILVFHGGLPKEMYEQNKGRVASQGRINVHFKVVDQYGEPATNYRFRVLLYSVKWYWRMFPATREKIRFYSLETDDKGNVDFRPLWSGYLLKPRELTTERYFLEKSNEGECGLKSQNVSNFKDTPGIKNVELHVIKHDPPEKLVGLHFYTKEMPINIDKDAPDDMVVALKLYRKSGKLDDLFEKYWVTLKATIVGAKAMGIAYEENKRMNKPVVPDLPIKLIIEGDDDLQLVSKAVLLTNFPFAPSEGYSKVIEVKYDDKIKDIPTCFIKNEKKGKPIFYRFKAQLIPLGDHFDLNIACVLNPSGSRNFYQELKPVSNP